MPNVGAEVAWEETQQRSVTGARHSGARAYVDIARRLDGDPHIVLEFEEARGVDAIEGVVTRAGLGDSPSAERIYRFLRELEELVARDSRISAANQLREDIVESRRRCSRQIVSGRL